MIRRGIILAAVVGLLAVLGPGAHASPDRLVISATNTNAVIVKVPARAGTLAVGTKLQGTVYTWEHGDPPCDPTGTTVYAGHAWRAGNGVADRWGSLQRGDVIAVAGCRFAVDRREFWPASRPMGHLYTRSGPSRIVLVTCKSDDYSRRTVVFARRLRR